ncbi:50S ribosomal protein L21 [Patescibacteria group bacterium]
MKYVVVKAQGHQQKIHEGEELVLPRLKAEEGKTIALAPVLLFVDGAKILIGQPELKEVQVKAKVLKHFRGEKIRVATYKAKSRYRRVKGFRAEQTRVLIEKITVSSKKATKLAVKKTTKRGKRPASK